MPAPRLPRFERRPQAIPRFELTERDEEIVRIVARLRFARSTHVLSLISARYAGASEQKLKRRLQGLFHAGYLARPKAQLENYRAGAGSAPMLYCIGNAGADLLTSKHGFRRTAVDWTSKARTATRGELEHAAEVADFVTGFEVACRQHGHLEPIHFDEILGTIAPEATRENPRPYHWSVQHRAGGKETELYIIPDRTIGLRDRQRPDGRNRKFFFVESDRGTMPVVRANLAQSSLLRKLIGYGLTYRGEYHKHVYGLPNFRVLMIVPGRKRIESLIEAFRAHAASIAVSPRLFLFAEKGLLTAPEFFEYEWTDAEGHRHRLLD